jgi:hypothetical protein
MNGYFRNPVGVGMQGGILPRVVPTPGYCRNPVGFREQTDKSNHQDTGKDRFGTISERSIHLNGHANTTAPNPSGVTATARGSQNPECANTTDPNPKGVTAIAQGSQNPGCNINTKVNPKGVAENSRP